VEDLVSLAVVGSVWSDRPQHDPLSVTGRELVVVTEVTRGGWASLAGLSTGDLILRVQDQPVTDVASFDAIVKKLKEAKPSVVSIFVRRGYRTNFVFVQAYGKEGK
jgi:C-terminal processing protease CtpA/Prc